jgi:hypothetical protein
MTAPNPLVVQPQNANEASWDNVEGGGVFQALADAAAALTGAPRDAGGVASDVAGAGVELMGAAMNPLNALASAGVGWLIEHLEFLHEPLDWLAGDPTVIKAQAHTWHNVSAELGAVAGDYEHALAGLPGWDGAAVQAYRGAAESYIGALRAGSAHAAGVSESISTAGALVGTTRALIRDWIAELVGNLIVKAAVAMSVAAATLAASLAAFVADAVATAAALASKISTKIVSLVEKLGRSAGELRLMTSQFDRLGAEAERAAESVGHAYDRLKWPMKAAAEVGKQAATARDDQQGWRDQ